MTVEFYTKDDCALCDEARKVVRRLKKEFLFELKEINLAEDHPKFKEFFMAIPVVAIYGREFKGRIQEEELRKFLRELRPPTRIFHVAKFLEALGFLTVGVGLMYGLMGDMWLDLYFFLGGMIVFSIGRFLETREKKRGPTPVENLRPKR